MVVVIPFIAVFTMSVAAAGVAEPEGNLSPDEAAGSPDEAGALTDPGQERSETPYELSWAPHAVYTGAAFGVIGLFQLAVQPKLPGGYACNVDPNLGHCDPGDLNEIDRTVVGVFSKDWRRVSDAGMIAVMVWAAIGSAVDAWWGDSTTPISDFLTDSLVIAEATATTIVVTFLLKLAIRRPRPAQYSAGHSVRSVDQQLSFPSGHASATAAAATAYATTFVLRHPESPLRFFVIGGAASLTLLTGLARVAGGKHFYTDVLAGWAVGVAAGLLIPYWHLRADGPPPVVVSPSFGDGFGGLSVGGVF